MIKSGWKMSNAEPVVDTLSRLSQVLAAYPRLAVAVSGGVDSLTLASVAHSVLGSKVLMVHAQSPAVPGEATRRVRDLSKRFSWPLQCIDAGEFADERYRANPVNRCYFCKTNLYARLRDVWNGPIASGANLDDLGDYRPGLLAAKEKNVVHPLIEANITKASVRRLAAHMQLGDVAELPAQPCLSSRVETGIAINADDLFFVHRIERYLTGVLGHGDIRCRITADGVRIEVPDSVQTDGNTPWLRELEQRVHAEGRTVSEISTYHRGSAFLNKPRTV